MNKINLPKNFENINKDELKKIEGGADGYTSYAVIDDPFYTSDTFLGGSTNSNASSPLMSYFFSTFIEPLIRPIITSITNSLVNNFASMIQSYFLNFFS